MCGEQAKPETDTKQVASITTHNKVIFIAAFVRTSNPTITEACLFMKRSHFIIIRALTADYFRHVAFRLISIYCQSQE
jgi:hypothetical protein